MPYEFEPQTGQYPEDPRKWSVMPVIGELVTRTLDETASDDISATEHMATVMPELDPVSHTMHSSFA